MHARVFPPQWDDHGDVECGTEPTESSMEDAFAVKNVGKVARQVFKLILLDGRHRCRAMRQLKAERVYNRTGRALRFPRVIRAEGQAI